MQGQATAYWEVRMSPIKFLQNVELGGMNIVMIKPHKYSDSVGWRMSFLSLSLTFMEYPPVC